MVRTFDWRNGWDYWDDFFWMLEVKEMYFPYYPYWIDFRMGHC